MATVILSWRPPPARADDPWPAPTDVEGGTGGESAGSIPSPYAYGGEWNNPGAGQWFVGSNWLSGTVPVDYTNILVDMGRATIGAGETARVSYMDIGLANAGEVIVEAGGTLTTGSIYSSLMLGATAAGNGTLTINGGTVHFDAQFSMGFDGTALVTMNGGSLYAGWNARFGVNPGSFGHFVMNGGYFENQADNNFVTGVGGQGLLEMYADAHAVTDWWFVGGEYWRNTLQGAGDGVASINGTAIIDSKFGAVFAAGGGSSGYVTFNDASVLHIPQGSLWVGYEGDSSLTLNDSASVTTAGPSGTGLWIGAFAGSNGVVTLNDNASFITPADMQIGARSTGAFVMNGGFASARRVGLGTQATGDGTLRLNGGVLQANQVAGGSGSSAAYFDGGTLRALTDRADFISNLDTLQVDAGGAFIDSNGFDIGVVNSFFTGSGPLNKIGQGKLTISENNPGYTGAAAVQEGTLQVDGLLGGTMAVWNGARLQGIGTVGSTTLEAGGVVAPGNAPFGALTIAGNFIGKGGTVEVETDLGDDGSPSDRLIISGGTGSGSAYLSVINVGGEGDLTQLNGILVVDAINGAITAPGLFTLAGPVIAGPYEYSLYRGSVDGSNPNAWYLRSEISCDFAPEQPHCGDDIPDYRPETSLYAAVPAMTLLYGRLMLDTLHERRGTAVSSYAEGAPNAAWARVVGQHGDRDGSPIGIYGTGPKYDYDFWAFQGGMDLYRDGDVGSSRNHAGAFFAIGHGSGDVQHIGDGKAGENSFMAYSWGVILDALHARKRLR
ncbi:hypothetical protein [Hyphomicrobium sp. D-2]|uniref:hypothetical protein n=1 Tax=Hyphomicrobium sp. D-2 TaxID=3041621 RepID=UPI00245907C8|nr:hypothetical protein [Hyphomicrobium sp. D-2]MDH4981826.1 hypothetical protein [Hyphomicrobium sp. D-2]